MINEPKRLLRTPYLSPFILFSEISNPGNFFQCNFKISSDNLRNKRKEPKNFLDSRSEFTDHTPL